MTGGMKTLLAKSIDRTFRQELARTSVVAIGIRSGGAAFGFLFNVLLARALGREGTGTVLFCLNFATMTGLIATAGMDVVGLRELSRFGNDPSHASKIFGGIFCNTLLSAIVFSLGGLLFLLVFGASLARISDAWVWAASALMIFLTAFQKSLSDWLIALREGATSQFVFYFINRFSSVAILGAAVLVTGTALHSAKFFILVYAAGLSLAVLYAIRHVFGHFSLRRTLRTFGPSGPLLRDGVSCELQNAGFIALNLSPFVLLGALSNTSEVGLFGVSQRLVALIVLALTTISQLAMRDFARASGNRDCASLAHALTVSVRLTFVTAIGITTPLIAFAPLWVSVFGKAFGPAAPILALLSAGTCAQCLGMPFQSALLATNHELAARNVTLGCAAAGIALNVLLIPHWGAEGAAVGTGIGLAMQSFGHAACVLKLLAVRFDVGGLRIVPGLVIAGAQ